MYASFLPPPIAVTYDWAARAAWLEDRNGEGRPHHPQVYVRTPGVYIDEDIAELVALVNRHGCVTQMSCQDDNGGVGSVRRIWLDFRASASVARFVKLLDDPAEAGDPESVSNRLATTTVPDDWRAFRENRQWHYTTRTERFGGRIHAGAISVRFPYTDLAEVVRRLRFIPA
jgi:hypothetical protein